MNERIVALDIGDRRIGIAVSRWELLRSRLKHIRESDMVRMYGISAKSPSNMKRTAFCRVSRSTWTGRAGFKRKRSLNLPKS